MSLESKAEEQCGVNPPVISFGRDAAFFVGFFCAETISAFHGKRRLSTCNLQHRDALTNIATAAGAVDRDSPACEFGCGRNVKTRKTSLAGMSAFGRSGLENVAALVAVGCTTKLPRRLDLRLGGAQTLSGRREGKKKRSGID